MGIDSSPQSSCAFGNYHRQSKAFYGGLMSEELYLDPGPCSSLKVPSPCAKFLQWKRTLNVVI